MLIGLYISKNDIVISIFGEDYDPIGNKFINTDN